MAAPAKKVRFNGFTQPALADASGPKWNKLFPLGETFARGDFGEVTFSKQFLQTMVDNWAKAGKPKLSTDYWHFGDSDPSIQQPFENKLASGDITDVELRDDGLYGLFAWTDKARNCILSRELKCISPSFQINGSDRHTGEPQGPTLLGAALLNDPFLQELPQVAAAAAPRPTRMEMKRMDHTELCTHFGLDPNMTTPDQLKQHMSACRAAYEGQTDGKVPGVDAVKAAASETALKLTREENTKLAADNARLSADAVKLAERVKVIEAARFDEQVTALNTELLTGGYITAAQQEGVKKFATALGLAEAKTHYLAGGKKVATTEVGVPGATPEERSKFSGGAAKTEMTRLMDEYQASGLKADKAMAKLRREHPEVLKAARAATPSTVPAEA